MELQQLHEDAKKNLIMANIKSAIMILLQKKIRKTIKIMNKGNLLRISFKIEYNRIIGPWYITYPSIMLPYLIKLKIKIN